jgi:hypothetical protein
VTTARVAPLLMVPTPQLRFVWAPPPPHGRCTRLRVYFPLPYCALSAYLQEDRAKASRQSNFVLVREQVAVVATTVALEAARRAMYQRERRGRCVCGSWEGGSLQLWDPYLQLHSSKSPHLAHVYPRVGWAPRRWV